MKCQSLLLTYRKRGSGTLVKCFLDRIKENHTTALGICPKCGSQFGRQAVIRNKAAIKIVGGKVYWK